jgi:hypothetical protein
MSGDKRGANGGSACDDAGNVGRRSRRGRRERMRAKQNDTKRGGKWQREAMINGERGDGWAYTRRRWGMGRAGHCLGFL